MCQQNHFFNWFAHAEQKNILHLIHTEIRISIHVGRGFINWHLDSIDMEADEVYHIPA